MLRQKKILAAIFVLAIVCMIAFCSCDVGKAQVEDGLKEVLVVVGTDEYSVKTDTNYLHELLIELNEKSIIKYEYSEGAYGATIMGINSLKTDIDWDPFIAIYHSIDDVTLRADFGEYAMARYAYKGTEYYPSSVGIDQLPVYNGAVYVIEEVNL